MFDHNQKRLSENGSGNLQLFLDANRKLGSLNTAAHQTVARQVAEQGMVLLKNENHALPLDPARIKSIAVIGENAVRLHAHGGDSSGIKAFYEVTPLQGLVNRAGKDLCRGPAGGLPLV